MMKFRLVAFDGATIKTGYAIADFTDTSTELVSLGLLQGRGDMHFRMADLYESVVELVEQHKPDYFTVEDLKINPMTPNLPSKIKVAYAIGVIMAACGVKNLEAPVMLSARTMRSRWGSDIKDKGKLRQAVNKHCEVDLSRLGYPFGLSKNDEDISDALGHLIVVGGKIRRRLSGEPDEDEDPKPKKKKPKTRRDHKAK